MALAPTGVNWHTKRGEWQILFKELADISLWLPVAYNSITVRPKWQVLCQLTRVHSSRSPNVGDIDGLISTWVSNVVKRPVFGWEPTPLTDPDVEHILQKYPIKKRITIAHEGARIRISRGPDGSLRAERSISQTHAQWGDRSQSVGFRFPTSDEWEYACGSGAPTLFRWGDHVPCDRYPTDASAAEAAWRKQRVLSKGKLERPPEGFPPDWDYHRRPNALGLFIAADPYQWELVFEVGTRRGGDGGMTICGGAGYFVGWLTLATAYFEKHSCMHHPKEPLEPAFIVGRRMLYMD